MAESKNSSLSFSSFKYKYPIKASSAVAPLYCDIVAALGILLTLAFLPHFTIFNSSSLKMGLIKLRTSFWVFSLHILKFHTRQVEIRLSKIIFQKCHSHIQIVHIVADK